MIHTHISIDTESAIQIPNQSEVGTCNFLEKGGESRGGLHRFLCFPTNLTPNIPISTFLNQLLFDTNLIS
jgi:hypothetical protein